MSNVLHLLVQWLGAWLKPSPIAPEPDQMNLHDWADLPVHHPVCD